MLSGLIILPEMLNTLKKAMTTFRFQVRMHKRHWPQDTFVQDWLADGIIGLLTEQGWI